MKPSIILSIIKDKDKMPPEEFDRLMTLASIELNSIGYHPSAMGGVDFKMLEDLASAKSEIQKLKSNNAILHNSNMTWSTAFTEVCEKNYQLEAELAVMKNTIKVKLINLIKEL